MQNPSVYHRARTKQADSPRMTSSKISAPNAPFMSKAEAAHLTKTYGKARIILEYGAGGSTRIAARMPGKLVFSVESDPAWALRLQDEIRATDPVSPVIIWPVDIGETGPWGRPVSEQSWRRFHRYPLTIWDEPFFRQPDTILIDGRLRTACLATIMLRITRPVTVLFDDYGVRPLYRAVEPVIRPVRMIDTMAHFEITPDMVRKKDIGLLLAQFSVGSIHGTGEEFYQSGKPPW